MPDLFAKVRSGDDFEPRAEVWNGFIDAANDFRRRRNGSESSPLLDPSKNGIVPCKNTTASDRSRFQIMTVTGVLYSQSDYDEEFYNQPILTLGATGTPPEKFVILQEPIKAGELGRGMLCGLSAVQIDMIDATDDWADVISSDSTMLRSGPFGSARIIYVPSGTGTKWGYVAHGLFGPGFVIGKTTSSHAKGASGTINIYRGSTKGSEAWTGSYTVSAYNRFGDVAISKWVLLAWIQRGWEVIAAEC